MDNISEEYKEYKCWSKNEETPEGSKSVYVDELDNGFVVTISWTKKNKNSEYKSGRKKKYSQTNPLGDMKPDVSKESVTEFFNPPLYEV